MFPLDIFIKVLADCGFYVQGGVGMLLSEVKLSDFTKARCHLAARYVEETRKITRLRIRVERVIGNVCQRYKILTGTMPINQILLCEGILDKTVTVYCALINQCPTIL